MPLRWSQIVTGSILGSRQLLLKIHGFLDLHQKPAINFREVENLPDGEAAREDVAVAIDFRAAAPGFAVAT